MDTFPLTFRPFKNVEQARNETKHKSGSWLERKEEKCRSEIVAASHVFGGDGGWGWGRGVEGAFAEN